MERVCVTWLGGGSARCGDGDLSFHIWTSLGPILRLWLGQGPWTGPGSDSEGSVFAFVRIGDEARTWLPAGDSPSHGSWGSGGEGD